MRIEICGNIASGKTSLSKILKRFGYQAIRENFNSCPFLELFYSDLKSFALETEFFFPLDHLHQINISKEDKMVCDYSFALDYAYSKILLNDKERTIYYELIKCIVEKIEKPHIIVRIMCDSDDILTRIKKRNRNHEQNINRQFLQNLELEIDKSIFEIYPNTRVLTIKNSNSDNMLDAANNLNIYLKNYL